MKTPKFKYYKKTKKEVIIIYKKLISNHTKI